tara:strand:+ start:5138 stop:5779 length:642 start_codon:yes stop_codon:yes gene_type:complete
LSDNESFIEEVTEEVRRDKLYLFLKKYGWIAGLAVVLIVVGSIFVEIKRNERIVASEELGDLLEKAFSGDEEILSKSIKSVDKLLEDGSLISLLLRASLSEESSDFESARIAYDSILNNQNVPTSFKDFAKVKILLLIRDDSERVESILKELIRPGNPYRLLALEQKVFLRIRQGNWSDARNNIDLLMNDPEVSQGMQSRLRQVQTAISFGNL